MRKFFKIFFSVVVILYFSATMFYCFVAGTPEAGKGAATISFSTISRLTSTLRLSRAGCLREAVKML